MWIAYKLIFNWQTVFNWLHFIYSEQRNMLRETYICDNWYKNKLFIVPYFRNTYKREKTRISVECREDILLKETNNNMFLHKIIFKNIYSLPTLPLQRLSDISYTLILGLTMWLIASNGMLANVTQLKAALLLFCHNPEKVMPRLTSGPHRKIETLGAEIITPLFAQPWSTLNKWQWF